MSRTYEVPLYCNSPLSLKRNRPTLSIERIFKSLIYLLFETIPIFHLFILLKNNVLQISTK